LFYTPVVWFIAQPLQVAQQPKPVDAIIVLGGGVGESGKANQGYEERVEYAVNLYKKGYAKTLIFSSGYMYRFKEPLVMEALAVSLGVPQQEIILEDKATSTYEHILFSKKILLEHHWSRVIVVSSAYHMARVRFVARRLAPDITFLYCPVPDSLFYSRSSISYGRKIEARQIKGIVHEFIGIIYYWFKGYI
jgi:uncharacterized SAM-binding protein YcdF (DUF218 family)